MTTKAKSNKSKQRVLIVDDHPMMRQGLAQLINGEPDLVTCCEADTARQAFELIRLNQPDLVLVDVSLPDKSGLELIKDVHMLQPALPLLVVSMHDEMLYAERVLRAGARGYIMKQEGGRKLMEAIRQVLAGRIYVSERMAARILEVFSGRQHENTASPVGKLSDREFEVFRFIGQGHSTREIAEQLHLSVKTIEVHRCNIKEKLGLKTVTALVRYAVRWTDLQGE